jgi:predicted NAD/FAD-binding protein
VRIAVIGSGISGLGIAYLAHFTHHVTLYEVADRIGGHSNTVDAIFPDRVVPVDTGFIVYNTHNYPNLVGLFKHLGVETLKTDMSFSVSLANRTFEYEGSLRGLTAQPTNLLRPRYWQMLNGLVKFYRTAVIESQHGSKTETLREFIQRCGLSEAFVNDHLLPMGAAIWSCSAKSMLDYPARSFVQFMDNHKLLHFGGRPAWRTVKGGSREYVSKIQLCLEERIEKNKKINSVRRFPGGVIVNIEGQGDVKYDKVIMAAHADESLKLMTDASEHEKNILSAFRFSENRVILHSDDRLMPKRKRTWAAWNYLSDDQENLCVTYWMNSLQHIDMATPLFTTLNPTIEPSNELLHADLLYHHPVFNSQSLWAQQRLKEIQGQNNIFWCGAWTANGFHEDGLKSAVAAAKTLDIAIPWNSPTEGYRVNQPMDHVASQ